MTSSCRTPLIDPQFAATSVRARPSTHHAPFVASAPGLDAAYDLGGEFRVAQELVDECGKDLLSGGAGKSEVESVIGDGVPRA
ncbi:MAG TPA: hypothetical protein VEF72_04155 [Mycobacterium sp.]|nr:hypothetical protein [Mycobacterium sp.]